MTVFRVDLTSRLLLAVASHGTDDGVLLAAETVHGALGVSLGLSSVVLGLTLGMLLLPGLSPGLGAGEVADGLDDVALQGVVLTGGLAAMRVHVSNTFGTARKTCDAYLGSPLLLLKDMIVIGLCE